MKADRELESYFAEANAWDADREALRDRSVRTAWRVAVAAAVLLALAVVALVLLMPLKRVEPFLVRVDNATGIVDVVPVFVGGASMPETVTRYFIDHYVTVCERFNFSTAESDYEECSAFHAAARNQAWFAQWDRSNPASPLNVYKDGTTVRAQVSAISFFERASGVGDLAQVRYTKTRRPAGGGHDEVSHWIGTLQYVYAEPSKQPNIRRWNPLGFKIADFRPEPEVIADPPAVERDPAKREAPGAAR